MRHLLPGYCRQSWRSWLNCSTAIRIETRFFDAAWTEAERHAESIPRGSGGFSATVSFGASRFGEGLLRPGRAPAVAVFFIAICMDRRLAIHGLLKASPNRRGYHRKSPILWLTEYRRTRFWRLCPAIPALTGGSQAGQRPVLEALLAGTTRAVDRAPAALRSCRLRAFTAGTGAGRASRSVLRHDGLAISRSAGWSAACTDLARRWPTFAPSPIRAAKASWTIASKSARIRRRELELRLDTEIDVGW